MKSEEHELLRIFKHLAPEKQDKLLELAEFLTAGHESRHAAPAAEPQPIPRPAEETVAMAIRRLLSTYPMLDRRRLMTEASHSLADHALRGRAAREVIDDLETVFARDYERHRDTR